ncbi:MAG TPA: hypothetical protein PLU17_12750, partial [Chitinophagaceae bacterium]|nr:hypothetical protein [Chitinophagaceae bacterium]
MKQKTNTKPPLSKSILRILYGSLAFILFSCSTLYSQTVTITANPGTTGNGPMGSSTYHCSEHIYTQAEISAQTTSAPLPISFIRFNMSTLTVLPFTNVNIYLRTTAASTFTAAGTYPDITGYTLVYSGAMNWTAVGFAGVNLIAPFSYPNTPGTNLQMMVVRNNSSGNVGHAFASANGNSTSGTLNTCRRYNSTLAPVIGSSIMQLTAFRAAIEFGTVVNNDANVANIYTLGKMPIEYGAPTIIQANITNSGVVPQINLPVSLNITGTNSFSNTQIIASLAPGASTVVSFATYSPALLSTNDVVTVSIPSDDNLSNNSKTWNMVITQNVYSYKNAALPNSGGVGFNGGTGDFVAKFNSNPGVTPPYTAPPQINEIKVDFAATAAPTQTYKMGIWDATGAGGTPGTLLWESAVLTQAAGTAFIPVPNIAVSGDYFVGVRQTGTVNISFAYQSENPIRSGTFYYASPTGATNWTDFSPASPFRFSVEVQVRIPAPPNCAINFSPADASLATCNTPILSWGSGGGSPTGYDVFLDTSPTDVANFDPIVQVSTNQPGTTFNPGTLLPNTTYYWAVLPQNADGPALSCGIQSFTTGSLSFCHCIPTYTGTICAGSISAVSINTLTNTSVCAPPAHKI